MYLFVKSGLSYIIAQTPVYFNLSYRRSILKVLINSSAMQMMFFNNKLRLPLVFSHQVNHSKRHPRNFDSISKTSKLDFHITSKTKGRNCWSKPNQASKAKK